MEAKKRIYCIEGVHDWGDGQIEPTVEPMLELLQKLGYWEDYLYRTCATMEELKYRLRNEWTETCDKGSVLYFCTHGSENLIWLQDEHMMGAVTLKELMDCRGCHIHFGGCDTFSAGDQNLKELMDYTGASSVSGYATKVGWLDKSEPAVALELLFFALLGEVNLAYGGRSRSKRLAEIRNEMANRFPKCKFNMLIRRYRSSKAGQ